MVFLQDILQNDDFSLDEMFISSLVSDLIKVSIIIIYLYNVHVLVMFCLGFCPFVLAH